MIYKQIAELCKLKGISIAKLEKETGISNGTIARWEQSSPTAANLEKIADYFDVSVDYLMGREGSKTTSAEDNGQDCY